MHAHPDTPTHLGHIEEIYREETRGKLCHADIFSLLTIENYINSLFYPANFDHAEEKTIHIIEVFMFFLCKSYILRHLYHSLLCFLYISI